MMHEAHLMRVYAQARALNQTLDRLPKYALESLHLTERVRSDARALQHQAWRALRTYRAKKNAKH